MDGTETSALLEDLSSLTQYEIAVFAVYTASASEALRGSETTRELHTRIHTNTHEHTHTITRRSVPSNRDLIQCAI